MIHVNPFLLDCYLIKSSGKFALDIVESQYLRFIES